MYNVECIVINNELLVWLVIVVVVVFIVKDIKVWVLRLKVIVDCVC